MPLVPVLGRQRQEWHKFKVSLVYIASSMLYETAKNGGNKEDIKSLLKIPHFSFLIKYYQLAAAILNSTGFN